MHATFSAGMCWARGIISYTRSFSIVQEDCSWNEISHWGGKSKTRIVTLARTNVTSSSMYVFGESEHSWGKWGYDPGWRHRDNQWFSTNQKFYFLEKFTNRPTAGRFNVFLLVWMPSLLCRFCVGIRSMPTYSRDRSLFRPHRRG